MAQAILWDTAVLSRDVEAFHKELESYCLPAYQVLIDERCRYMAHLIRTTAIPGADIMVVCTAVADILRRAPTEDADDMVRIACRNVSIWPLFLFAYGLIPGGIALYAALSVWESFLAPA